MAQVRSVTQSAGRESRLLEARDGLFKCAAVWRQQLSWRFQVVELTLLSMICVVQYGDEDSIIKCVDDNYGKAENFDPDAETPYRSMTNQHSMYHQVDACVLDP